MSAIPRRNVGGTRLATETKHAFKTTEFYAYVAMLAAVFIAGLASDDFGTSEVWLYATLLTFGYMLSRGIAKAASREPYWEGGHNEAREKDFGVRDEPRSGSTVT